MLNLSKSRPARTYALRSDENRPGGGGRLTFGTNCYTMERDKKHLTTEKDKPCDLKN